VQRNTARFGVRCFFNVNYPRVAVVGRESFPAIVPRGVGKGLPTYGDG
jgi:hypothetical protein